MLPPHFSLLVAMLRLSAFQIQCVSMRPTEAMDTGIYPPGPYPEREGEPDCSFYLRTRLCRFGSTCRFNHPPNRKLALATERMKGEFPERIGQPECQFAQVLEDTMNTVISEAALANTSWGHFSTASNEFSSFDCVLPGSMYSQLG